MEIKQEENSEDPIEQYTEYCERTFITFLNDINDEAFNNIFPKVERNPKHKPSVCAVTGLKAKYIDPVTQLPYYNVQAFKILREAYYQQLEARGDRSNPDVEKWIQWRLKQKELRQQIKMNLTRNNLYIK